MSLVGAGQRRGERLPVQDASPAGSLHGGLRAHTQNMLSDESRTTLVRLCALKEGPDDAVRVCGDQSGETRAQQSVCVRGG